MRVTGGRVLTSATSRGKNRRDISQLACRLPRDTLDIRAIIVQRRVYRGRKKKKKEKKNARSIIKKFNPNGSGFVKGEIF